MIDKAQIQNYIEQTGDQQDILSQLDVALSDIERQILSRLDKLQTRPALFEATEAFDCWWQRPAVHRSGQRSDVVTA